MKTFIVVCVCILLVGGCSSHKEAADSTPGAKLTLEGDPHQGFAPLRVTFRAVLESVSQSDQNYYCLEEKWDFGDGSVSSEKPHCDPYQPDTKIKTEFIVDHLYDEEGSFKVFLTLGDKKIRSRNVPVIVFHQPSKP